MHWIHSWSFTHSFIWRIHQQCFSYFIFEQYSAAMPDEKFYCRWSAIWKKSSIDYTYWQNIRDGVYIMQLTMIIESWVTGIWSFKHVDSDIFFINIFEDIRDARFWRFTSLMTYNRIKTSFYQSMLWMTSYSQPIIDITESSTRKIEPNILFHL